jgi:hypothetical protein
VRTRVCGQWRQLSCCTLGITWHLSHTMMCARSKPGLRSARGVVCGGGGEVRGPHKELHQLLGPVLKGCS